MILKIGATNNLNSQQSIVLPPYPLTILPVIFLPTYPLTTLLTYPPYPLIFLSTYPSEIHWTGWMFSLTKETPGLAYVLAINGLYQVFFQRYPFKPISNSGKMALTNYILQTLICILIFYGFG